MQKRYLTLIALSTLIFLPSCYTEKASNDPYAVGTSDQLSTESTPSWLMDSASSDTATYTPVASSAPSSYSETKDTYKPKTITPKNTVTKASTTKGAKYVVKRGDSLSRIASQNRTTVSALKKANGLRSDKILAGQTLTIPKK